MAKMTWQKYRSSRGRHRIKYWTQGRMLNMSNSRRAPVALAPAPSPRQGDGRCGAEAKREDRREWTCRSKSMVRVFTRELGDPRGTWVDDRSMRLHAIPKRSLAGRRLIPSPR
jgi:hypothetical protein